MLILSEMSFFLAAESFTLGFTVLSISAEGNIKPISTSLAVDIEEHLQEIRKMMALSERERESARLSFKYVGKAE